VKDWQVNHRHHYYKEDIMHTNIVKEHIMALLHNGVSYRNLRIHMRPKEIDARDRIFIPAIRPDTYIPLVISQTEAHPLPDNIVEGPFAPSMLIDEQVHV
jgi:hypothetical protein